MVMLRRSASLLLGVLFAMSPLLASGACIGFGGLSGAPAGGRFAALDEGRPFPGGTDRFRSPVFDGYRLLGAFRSGGGIQATVAGDPNDSGIRVGGGVPSAIQVVGALPVELIAAGPAALPALPVPVSVPEPGTLVLLVSGLVGLAALRNNEPEK